MIVGRYGTFSTRAEYVRAWRKSNWSRIKDTVAAQTKAWHAAHPEIRRRMMRSWRDRNKDRIREYYRHKRHTDIQTMLATRLRSRINSVLKRRKLRKTNTTVLLIGIGLDGFREYIESKFLPGMTWLNRNLWHIDHKKPCSSFDLSKPDQQKECFHYTNLQPLWCKDNLSKSDKVL